MSSVNRTFASVGLPQRTNLIIWLKNGSDQRRLRRYGDIVYYSRRKHYLIMYVDLDQAANLCQKISHLNFVEKAEVSHRDDLHFEADYQTKMMHDLAEKAEQLRAENEDLRV